MSHLVLFLRNELDVSKLNIKEGCAASAIWYLLYSPVYAMVVMEFGVQVKITITKIYLAYR